MAVYGPSAGESTAVGGGGEFDSIVFGSYRQTKPVPLAKKDGFPSGPDGWKAAFGVCLKNCDDPDLQEEIYFQDDDFLVIYDGYPKARRHLLLLPKPSFLDIQQPSDLCDVHLPKLHRLHALAEAITRNLSHQWAGEVRYGYHALPSMKPLHIHIISQDFDGPGMRRNHHWNIFTTDIFMTPAFVEGELWTRGRLELDEEKCHQLKKQTPRCHVCGEREAHIEGIKTHYYSHFESRDATMIDAGQRRTTSQAPRPGLQQEPGEPAHPAADHDGAGGSQPAEGNQKKGKKPHKRARKKAARDKWKTKKGKRTAVEKSSGGDGLGEKEPVKKISERPGLGGLEAPEEGRYAESRGQEAMAVRESEGGPQGQGPSAGRLSEQGKTGTEHRHIFVGGATSGQERSAGPSVKGVEDQATMGEFKGDDNLGGRWAGEQVPRGELNHEERRPGSGSLRCYDRRELPKIWGNMPSGGGHGRREGNGEEGGRLVINGGLGLRRVADARGQTRNEGMWVPPGHQEGRPDGWESRHSEGWFGFHGPPATHYGDQGRPEAWHGLCRMCGIALAKRGQVDGEEWWSGITQHGEKRVAEALHGPHWMRGDRQAKIGQAHGEPSTQHEDEDKRGAGAMHGPHGICFDEEANRGQVHDGEWRNERTQRGDNRGGDPSHGPRRMCSDGQAGTGQAHGKEWWIDPEGSFGFQGLRGGKDGGKTDKEEWLRGFRADGLGRKVQEQTQASRGIGGGAAWHGGQQPGGVKQGENAATYGVWRSLRAPDGSKGNFTSPSQGEERCGGRDLRGPCKVQGPRRPQHERMGRRHEGWHGMVGFGVDRLGGTRGGHGRGNGWIGGTAGTGRERGQGLLRTSVHVQHMEGPMPHQQWVGGRTDQGWCGGTALQAGRSLGPRGREQAFNPDGAQFGAAYQEGKPDGFEPERPKRDRAELGGAVDHERGEGKKQRVGEGNKNEGSGRETILGQEKGTKSYPPDKQK